MERDIAEPTADMDVRTVLLTELPDSVKGVVSVLRVHPDREEQRVDEDILDSYSLVVRCVYHARGVGNTLFGGLWHSRLAGGCHHNLRIVLLGEVQRINAFQ